MPSWHCAQGTFGHSEYAWTCGGIFSGCDSPSDFAFTDALGGAAAASALLGQVFINTFAGNFDTNPALTRGCTNTAFCYVLIPTVGIVMVGSGGSAAYNDFGLLDETTTFGAGTAFDSTGVANFTWARFTVTSATGAVPEPATWAMMLMGFGAMGFALRRRKRATSIFQKA